MHKSFASLSQEEQKVANILLHEMQREDFIYEDGKTFRDYISEYMFKKHNDNVHACACTLGVDEKLLRSIMDLHLTSQTLNEFGRYDKLKNTVDKKKAKEYFEFEEGKPIPPHKVMGKVDSFLVNFILSGGFDISKPKTYA